MSKSNYLKPVQIRIFAIFALVVCLFAWMAVYLTYISHHSVEEAVLIDTFGRQRMLTQVIAKDANRKYGILLSLQAGPLIVTDQTLIQKIALINTSIGNAKSEFNTTLLALRTGVLIKGQSRFDIREAALKNKELIEKTEGLWRQFENSVGTLQETESVTPKAAEAILFINTQNETLLSYCDELNQAIVENVRHKEFSIILLSVVLFILLILSLIVSVYQLQKYIVSPLDALYTGLTEKGLMQMESKTPTANDIEPALTAIRDGFSKLDKTIELINNINNNVSFRDVLGYIYHTFRSFIPYSHIGIALLRDNGRVLEAAYAMSDPSLSDLPKNLTGIRETIENTSLTQVIREAKPRVINDLEAYTGGRSEVAAYNRILLDSGIRASITLPLIVSNDPVGVIFFSSTSKNVYNESHISFLKTLASAIAISLNQNIFIDDLLYSSVLALAKMAEARDEETGQHLRRMKEYAKRITELLVSDMRYDSIIDGEFLKNIERFSPMHDIGKVGVKDGILLKQGKLTVAEFEEMKKHTVYGAQVLKTAEYNLQQRQKRSVFGMGIEIVLGHHEKWDGTGYPYGKKREEIPLSARIVAVADVFDALTSERPYKEAYTFEASFQMLAEESGTHFDPSIIETVRRHKAEWEALYKYLGQLGTE